MSKAYKPLPNTEANPKLINEDLEARFELLRKIYKPTDTQEDTVKVVFVRHGESIWNKCGKFQGWTDVPLSKKGEMECHEAGKQLKNLGYNFDVVYTSMLQRATKTADIILGEMGLTDKVEVHKHWKINERHYGSLQGSDKKEMAEIHGAE